MNNDKSVSFLSCGAPLQQCSTLAVAVERRQFAQAGGRLLTLALNPELQLHAVSLPGGCNLLSRLAGL